MFRQIGQVLRETRERRGLSLPDVQTQTNIRSRYLEAMEDGEFQLIPGEVYARGFLRSYARFLGLDETELLQMYRKAWQDVSIEARSSLLEAPAVSPTRVARRPGEGGSGPTFRPRRSPRFLWPVTLLLITVSAVAIGLYYLGSGLGLSANNPGDDVPNPVTEAPPAPEPEPPPVAEPEPPVLTVVRQPADPARANYITFAVQQSEPFPFDVKLQSGAPCWWRATVNGQIIGEGTLAAGQELQWTVESGLSIHLGNPRDITLTIAGEFSEKITADQPRHLVVEGSAAP